MKNIEEWGFYAHPIGIIDDDNNNDQPIQMNRWHIQLLSKDRMHREQRHALAGEKCYYLIMGG